MRIMTTALSLGMTLALTSCSGDVDRPASAPVTAIPTRIADAELASGATDLNEMASQDIHVVTAVAGGVSYTTNPTDPSIPVTHQEFKTVKAIRGDVPSTFTIEFTGGPTTDGNSRYILQLEGQPQFETDRTYFLVLLGPKAAGEYFVFGGAQGRFDVTDGTLRAAPGASKADRIVSRLSGVNLAQAEDLLRPGQ